ncbi:MAG: Trypsin [Firmicutes bacterium ADurb.BinA205]|nr:MAG: Trypsin [Firmicutes bacterium ADurb.BinA205]
MKKTLKRFSSMSLITLMTFSTFFVSETYKAEAISTAVTLGDINQDGQITISDSLQVLYYITGQYAPTEYGVTAMDANEDGIIDNVDSDLIQYWALYSPTNNQPVVKDLYTLPNNEPRQYIKYDVATGVENDPYTLSAITNSGTNSNLLLNNSFILNNSDSGNHPDTQNTNVVQLSFNDGVGSGYIISDHVIATAAHCLYNVEDSQFVQNITVNIYNSNGTITSKTPSSLHIPVKYKTPDVGVSRDNYDYGLIYINDSLSQFGVWNVGIAVKEFMYQTPPLSITSSGFCQPSNYTDYTRYYSTGQVLNLDTLTGESHNLPAFRIATDGESVGGKSGGVMYYDSIGSYNSYKSAIAITTGGTSYRTWGCKLTPTLLKFYKHNTYLS